ncbi:hypothetical protein DM194_12985 (plasmid) [Azospirillum ramasamyi]|uniref:Uncharacterized protein n=2 Tax=Azospirillum ramasamyi TaxID=682998 RepID=A0A2U9S8K5_9PROT|nr:hypothetical protein DM194_12985 [Azospirillum ramasamyi]
MSSVYSRSLIATAVMLLVPVAQARAQEAARPMNQYWDVTVLSWYREAATWLFRNPSFEWYIPLVAAAAVAAVGNFYASRQAVTVFRTYNDLAATFLCPWLPVGLYYLADGLHLQVAGTVGDAITYTAVGAFAAIAILTFMDNPNPLKGLLALATKSLMGIAFFGLIVFAIAMLFSPASGKTASERRRSARNNRAASAAIAAIAVAILAFAATFVRNRERGIGHFVEDLRSRFA